MKSFAPNGDVLPVKHINRHLAYAMAGCCGAYALAVSQRGTNRHSREVLSLNLPKDNSQGIPDGMPPQSMMRAGAPGDMRTRCD